MERFYLHLGNPGCIYNPYPLLINSLPPPQSKKMKKMGYIRLLGWCFRVVYGVRWTCRVKSGNSWFWLFLLAVVCMSHTLSHACLSASSTSMDTAKLRTAQKSRSSRRRRRRSSSSSSSSSCYDCFLTVFLLQISQRLWPFQNHGPETAPFDPWSRLRCKRILVFEAHPISTRGCSKICFLGAFRSGFP